MRFFHSNTGKFDLTSAIIVGDGNSLTYGYQASNPATKNYIALLDADTDFNGCTFYNFGVTAQTTQDMINDAVTQVDAVYSSSVNSILIAWEVGNDIYFNGDVNAAISRFWSYCDARRAKGWKVYVITNTPRDQTTSFGDNSAQYNTKLLAANTQLLAEWPFHANGIIDLAADSRFVGYDLTYYNADKVHYTDAGYQVVKDLVKAKLK